jgi:tRNA modification GTPase
LNKADLGEDESWRGRRCSANFLHYLQRHGGTRRSQSNVTFSVGPRLSGNWTVAINARHQACLERARDFLTAAQRAFEEKLSAEFIAEELRVALDAVGEIIGKADTEELLGVISAAFASANERERFSWRP